MSEDLTIAVVAGRLGKSVRWLNDRINEDARRPLPAPPAIRSEEAKAREQSGAACYDCGLRYDDPGFADLVVKGDGGGA